jgi:hypothetical protein
MTYADLVAARPLSNAADRRGSVLAHANDPSHLFVTQSLLSWDRVPYPSGNLEHTFELKHVGRAQGGHLFRTGFAAQTWAFNGVVCLETQCGSTYSATDAYLELQLLRQFLRGFADAPYSDDFPDPRIKVGYLVNHRIGESVPASHPFAPDYPFASPEGDVTYPFAPPSTESNIAFYNGVFVYVAQSFQADDVYSGADLLNFSFQLQELPPANTVIT